MKLKDYGILSILLATTLAAVPALSQEKGKGMEKGEHEGRQTAIGGNSKQTKQFVAGKATNKDTTKALHRRENKQLARGESKNIHKSSSSHGRLAGELPPGLERYEEKHGGHLPPGLEKQLNEKGHLPPGLEKGGRR